MYWEHLSLQWSLNCPYSLNTESELPRYYKDRVVQQDTVNVYTETEQILLICGR